MRTVEVSRFLQAHPREVERLLTPETVLDYEGTFTAVDVEEINGNAVVDAQGGGGLMEARFVFEDRDDGFVYRQVEQAGPFEAMETEITVGPENEGTRVSMRSSVSLALPLPLADRVAAWKRRGELKRALKHLADDVE